MSEEITPEPAPVSVPASNPSSNGNYLYFRKVIASMPYYVNRIPVQFEPLSGNGGVLKLASTDPLATALAQAAEARRGGIVRIDEPTYDELKKKRPFNPSEIKSKKHVLQVFQYDRRPPKPAKDESVAVAKSISGEAAGVGLVGTRGTGADAGTLAPVPAPQPEPTSEFVPATAKKSFKMPVLKKTESRSLSGGTPITDEE